MGTTGAADHRGPIVAAVAGEGPPLVLLHGLAGSARWWSKNIPALAEEFCVIAMDLPGFGDSHPGSGFDLHEAAGEVVEALDRLDIDRASVVGHSMGALVASGMAADFPDCVDRLVLVDAAVFSFHRGLMRRTFGAVGILRSVPLGFYPTLVRDALRSGPLRIASATFQVLLADWTSKLPSIVAPTLVVWGEDDSLTPMAIGERMVEEIPDAELAVIRDAGHNPMWDEPEEFDRVVLEFLLEGEAAVPTAPAASSPAPPD